MRADGVRPGTRGVLALIAAAVSGIGCLALAASLRIPEGQGYTAVGPEVFPVVVSALLAVLGVVLLLRATLWPDRDLLRRVEDEARATHWPAPGTIALALLLYALMLEPLGFVLATAPLFAASAWALEDRRPIRTLSFGLVLSLVTYFGFTRLLGVRLPAGLLDGIL